MTVDAPGRSSIEAAFRAAYGTQEPERRAPPADQRPPAPGAVLDAINAYRGEDHWHLVTLGLTDLAGPSSGSQISGLGHELTLLTPPAEHAPEWAFALLLGVARTVRAVGRPLHAGARLAPGHATPRRCVWLCRHRARQGGAVLRRGLRRRAGQ